MIKPELKRLHSPDHVDLHNLTIDERTPFSILVQALFSPEGEDGEESFDVVVCNSLWVTNEAKRGAFSGRHHLIVDHFDVKEIRAFWQQIAAESTGATWAEVGAKLGRYGKWEFEDYADRYEL